MLALITSANQRAISFLKTPPRQPALTHALDPELFTPALCDTMAYCQDQRLLLQGYDSIWGLYWIRRFYNDSDGNNYQQVGQDIIQSALTQWLRPTNAYPGLPPNATTGEKLRSECPIISAESQGQTSQLIQGMRFLLDELRPGFDTDDYDSALARWQARPNASKGQIAAARLYPEAFKTVIHALLTGEGEGWLTRFTNHPLRRETLQWGVYCNGNHHDLALCVPTNATQVIRQGNKELRVRPFQGRLIVPLGSMLRAGIDASAPCFIGNDPLPPLNLYSPLIARVRRNTPFTPFIESRANLQIQATALWTANPVDQKGDFLLGNQLPVIDNPRDIPNYGRLCKLALGHIDRTQPQPLTFNNQWLVNIGAAPELAVTDPDPWIQSLQEPQTHFVFADQASLTLSDLDTNQNAWSFSPGATLEWVNGQPILHSNTNYGRRLAVSVDVGLNYPLRVVIRFLPPEMRQAMINEQAWERDGVSWTPLCPSDNEFQLAITQAGLIRGTLTVGDGTPVWVWFPSMKPHFWFRHGFNPPTQVDRCDHFSELDELREQYLHVYIPPGRHSIRWGGEDYLECEGPGYWEEPLNDLDREWPERDSDDLEIFHPNGQTTRIATVMDRPQGSTVSVPEFEEGGFEQYLGTEFHLTELARHLDWMIVDGTPWPTSWSWSGQSLQRRFNAIYTRCTLSQNGQLRNPPVAPNPAAIRKLNPILEGLQIISQGNRPDQVWLVINTFRLRPAAPAYGFHGLLNGGPVRWLLQDPQQTQIRSEFAYEGNTVFRLPTGQAPLLWQASVQPNNLNQQAAREVDLRLQPEDHQLVRGYFLAALGWSESLIGGWNENHLAYVFQSATEAFAVNPDRSLCFEVAVLCRLHARVEAHSEIIPNDDPIRRLAQPKIRELLKNLCLSIGQNADARDVFGSDLLTVDWALAWFHEPI